jgi:addiction module HigA family antidote
LILLEMKVVDYHLGEDTVRKRPVYPIHPGEILANELAELDNSPTALARELHIPANRISQLIAGKRAMTADTALRLEKWLGVSASFWMNLQKRYELDVLRNKKHDGLKSHQADSLEQATSRRATRIATLSVDGINEVAYSTPHSSTPSRRL